ncbi:MAG: MMPL family transporter [Lachnospiraceae bacterium]|nr:MMPL family transporter [Lachnospiraceae bacterium]
MNEEKEKSSVMVKVATFIVDRRNLFFLLVAIAAVFSLISAGWVSVEDSLPAYLPETTETRRGLDLMEEEFTTYGTAKIMATNIDYATADSIAARIRSRPDVAILQFDDTDSHYNNFSARYDIILKYEEDDPQALASLEEIKEMLKGYDLYVSTTMGNQQADIIEHEMDTVSVIVAIIVVIVLILTSQTWAEIPVLLLTFGASAIIAAGTNFILGTISFVSDSVTVVLQLALSIDYAVIFCNRFKEEHQTLDVREADIIALSKAIPEIAASSLTTVGGLIAMMFMQYGIGPDMAICLIKAIAFSLLSVFTFMPGLLMPFGKLMDKTRHRSFIPKISFVGKLDYLTRFIVPPAFLALIIGAFLISNKCPYVYGYSTLSTPVLNEIQIANDMIDETFGKENLSALMVPNAGYDVEARLIKELESRDEVDKIIGLSNTEARDGYNLTDKLTARQFSELMGVDYELAELLYTAYAINDENYAKLINGASSYAIPLIDVVMFLHDEADEGYVTLDDDTQAELDEAYDDMMVAKKQLQGENYSRMLVYLTLPEEGEETFAFLDEVHDIARKYYTGDVIIAGESNSQYDLKKTFARDNLVVNWVSIFAVLVVLLFTFMSVGMPILLILVIQGAIWINFAYPTIMHDNIFFMCYLIVSSIQMGANIDYAIVISGRFMELKDKMSKRDAIIETMNFAFPTIVTSGSMLALAGLSIGSLSSDPTICGIGQCIARGTLISIILVMFVLPQILLIGEKIIDASSFKVSVPIKINTEAGLIRLDGVVQGNLNGHFVGEMHGILRGNASVLLATGTMRKEEEDTAKEELLEDKQNIVDGKAEEKPEEDTVKEAEKNRAEGEEAKTPDGGSDNKTETAGTADDTGIKPNVTNESGAGDDKVQ